MVIFDKNYMHACLIVCWYWLLVYILVCLFINSYAMCLYVRLFTNIVCYITTNIVFINLF